MNDAPNDADPTPATLIARTVLAAVEALRPMAAIYTSGVSEEMVRAAWKTINDGKDWERQGGDYVLVPRAKMEEWRKRFLGYKADDEPHWNYSHLIAAIDDMNAMLAAAPPQPIPTPDEALMPASMLSHMMPNPTKHAERLYSRDQMLNYGERIRNATLAALSRARPEDDKS